MKDGNLQIYVSWFFIWKECLQGISGNICTLLSRVRKWTLGGQQKSDYSQFYFPRALVDALQDLFFFSLPAVFESSSLGYSLVLITVSRLLLCDQQSKNCRNLMHTLRISDNTQIPTQFPMKHPSCCTATSLICLQSFVCICSLKAFFTIFYSFCCYSCISFVCLSVDKRNTLRPPVLHHVLILWNRDSLRSVKHSKAVNSVFQGRRWFEWKWLEVALRVMLVDLYICRTKVSDDYEALNQRLQTLPDQLSYDIMVGARPAVPFSQLFPHCERCVSWHQICSVQVPFGSLAFMPGKLVHTNEITVLLGDNWFAKCSAKQAQDLVAHRMERKCAVFIYHYH